MISPPNMQCFVKQAKLVERRLAKILYDKLSALPAEELQKVQDRVNSSFIVSLDRNSNKAMRALARYNRAKGAGIDPASVLGDISDVHNKAMHARFNDGASVSRKNILEYLKLLSEGKGYPHTSLVAGNGSGVISTGMVNDLMRIVKGDAKFDAPNFSSASSTDLLPKVHISRATGKIKDILAKVPEDPVLVALSGRYGVPVEEIKGIVRQVNAEPFGKLLFTPHIANPVPNLAFEMGKGNKHAGSIKKVLDEFVDPWEAIPARNMQAAAAAGSGAKAAERDFLLANKAFRIVDPRHYPKKFAENTATTRRGRYDGAFYETVIPQAYTPYLNKNTQRVFLTTSTKPSNGRVLTVDQLASRTAGKPLLFKGQPIEDNFNYNMESEMEGGVSALNSRGAAGAGWWFSPNVRTASNYGKAEPGSGASTYLLPVPAGTNITSRKQEVANKLAEHIIHRYYM